MSEKEAAQELSLLIEDYLGHDADVFWAVREVEGKLVKGFWYRIWKDAKREEWTKFGFLGETRARARRAIRRLKSS